MIRSARTRSLLAAIFLLAAVLVAYRGVLDCGFTNYDDPEYVTDNPVVRSGLGLEGLRWALTATHAANWHPLTWVSHMLDQSLHGSDPRGHHLTSLVLHAANTLLLFLLLERMTGAPMRSALAALLFGVHPLHVESVAWIAERKDVLSTLVWLLASLAYLAHVRSERGRFAPVAILLALGLAAKPMLVTLPLALLLLDYWPLARWVDGSPQAARRARALVVEKLPLVPLVLASALVTYVVQSRSGAVDPIPLSQRLANAAVAAVVYLRKAIWPVDLAVLYPHPRDTLPAWQVLFALGLLAAVTVLVVRARRRRPYLLFGWLWYLVTLLPVIGIVQVGQQALADRYTYVPLIGPFVAASFALAELGRAGRQETVAAIAGLLLAPALVVGTAMQVSYWKDSVTLFERALAETAANPGAHVNLGSAYRARGETARAAEQFRKALEIDPRRASAHYDMGILLAGEGRLAEAEEHYRAALASKPSDTRILNNLALVLVEGGRRAEAIELYERALVLDPARAPVHNNLGIALAAEGRTEDAIRHWQEALRLDPDRGDASAHNNLGIALASRGRSEEAIRHYEEAIRIDPAHARALNNLGLELAKLGRTAEAIERFRGAVRASPGYGAAHSNLAGALYQKGDYAGAREHLQLAEGLGQEPPPALVRGLERQMEKKP